MKTCIRLFFSTILFLTLISGVYAFASEMPDCVRVGLEYKYKKVSSVPVSDKNISFGIEYNGRFLEEGETSSASGFLVSPGNGFFVDVKERYESYQDALYDCGTYASSGYKAVPSYLGRENWGIFITGFPSESAANGEASKYGGSVVLASEFSELSGSTGTVFVSSVNFQIKPGYGSGYITLGDRSYRGRIEFFISSSSITAINVVPLEEYLYSVVPSEMPKSYENEALKAQACAARTYTVSKLGAHSADGYDVCDGENCQLYKGVSSEAVSTTNAVDSTSGEIIYCGGSPINAVFFSSSGGYTDNSENVWSAVVSYLKAVSDPYEYDTKVWKRAYSKSDIKDMAIAYGSPVGNITDMYISAASNSGRVNELTITGANGSIKLTKEKIRTFFSFGEGSLESRLFTVNGETTAVYSGSSVSTGENYAVCSNGVSIKLSGSQIYITKDGLSAFNVLSSGLFKLDGKGTLSPFNALSAYTGNVNESNYAKTTKTADFILNGVGFGHGVGMSQKGANGMAKAGFDYIDILTHYYTGVSVY